MSRCLSPAAEAHSNLGATLFRKRLLGVNFGGRIPTLSRSFSSEKSYSPSKLMCCQEITEPCHSIEKHLPALGIRHLFQLLRQIEIIPADNAVLDEPLAGFGHLLVFLFRLEEFPRVAH